MLGVHDHAKHPTLGQSTTHANHRRVIQAREQIDLLDEALALVGTDRAPERADLDRNQLVVVRSIAALQPNARADATTHGDHRKARRHQREVVILLGRLLEAGARGVVVVLDQRHHREVEAREPLIAGLGVAGHDRLKGLASALVPATLRLARDPRVGQPHAAEPQQIEGRQRLDPTRQRVDQLIDLVRIDAKRRIDAEIDACGNRSQHAAEREHTQPLARARRRRITGRSRDQSCDHTREPLARERHGLHVAALAQLLGLDRGDARHEQVMDPVGRDALHDREDLPQIGITQIEAEEHQRRGLHRLLDELAQIVILPQIVAQRRVQHVAVRLVEQTHRDVADHRRPRVPASFVGASDQVRVRGRQAAAPVDLAQLAHAVRQRLVFVDLGSERDIDRVGATVLTNPIEHRLAVAGEQSLELGCSLGAGYQLSQQLGRVGSPGQSAESGPSPQHAIAPTERSRQITRNLLHDVSSARPQPRQSANGRIQPLARPPRPAVAGAREMALICPPRPSPSSRPPPTRGGDPLHR